MSDAAIQLLEAEKARRVAALLTRHPESADDLKAVFTISDTIYLIKQPVPRTRSRGAASQGEPTNDTPAPEGFSLSDEVRRAIQKIDAERFRASTVYDLMHERWPDYITPDKKPRIGATLSNLVTAEELGFEKDGQRKTWYHVLNLRAVEKDDLAFITEFTRTAVN